MNHEILRGRVEEACNKIADHGIEGCDEKEVVLACFGMLMFNGIDDLKRTVTRAMWMGLAIGLSAVVSIVIAVVLA